MYNPQLETFLTVAEAGSFNKAAEKLYISPPAVIKQINLLERDLDLRLFLRTHRGLQLTKAGQSLYRTPNTSSSTAKTPSPGQGTPWRRPARSSASAPPP